MHTMWYVKGIVLTSKLSTHYSLPARPVGAL